MKEGNECCRSMQCIGGANNVYRTENYIVAQYITVTENRLGEDVLFSDDTFFRRTYERDCDYEEHFGYRGARINGRRTVTTASTRMYAD